MEYLLLRCLIVVAQVPLDQKVFISRLITIILTISRQQEENRI